ncbi:MAG: hypothetical protein PHQ35_10025 [Phycisphaerae bacterium]|nr:hypothetical protein [Phycisphaerae bacterium]MDD5381973.1 hypothetical protein [Phycisphaerae bacterium]
MEREEQNRHYKSRYKKQAIVSATVVSVCVIWFLLTLSKTNKDVKGVKNWIEVPCLIKNVKLDVHPMANPPIFYRVISYEYEYKGSLYTSSRYNIVEKNKVIGGKEKEEIKKTRKAGKEVKGPYSLEDETVCFVNNKNPIESVLVREVRNGAIIIKRLLLPIVVGVNFLIVFLGALWKYWFWD